MAAVTFKVELLAVNAAFIATVPPVIVIGPATSMAVEVVMFCVLPVFPMVNPPNLVAELKLSLNV